MSPDRGDCDRYNSKDIDSLSMASLVNATQRDKIQRTRAYLDSLKDPAIQGDDFLNKRIREFGELALIQSGLEGRQDFKAGTDKKVYGGSPVLDDRGNQKLQQFELEDTPFEFTGEDLRDLQIAETRNALRNDVSVPEKFAAFTPEEKAIVGEILQRNLRQGDLTKYARAGTNNRRYSPEKFPELAGQVIPVTESPEYLQDRSVKLYTDIIGGVDPDTGAGLYGVALDAMHRNPASQYPEQIARIENIKMGPQSMNQSDGDREDSKVRGSRETRLSRLLTEENVADNLAVDPSYKMTKAGQTIVPVGASPKLIKDLKADTSRQRRELKEVERRFAADEDYPMIVNALLSLNNRRP